MPAKHILAENLRGAFFMTMSMAAFTVNDMFMKLAFDDFGLYQAIFLRGVPATLMVAALALQAGVLTLRPVRADLGLLGWRTFGEIGSTFSFLAALTVLPLATVSALMQAAPLAITVAAALLLRERVGWQRALAVGVGFVGVMLIVQPGAEGFSAASVLGLLTVVFIVLRDFATRRLTRGLPSLYVALITSVAITLTGGLAALTEPWRPVSAGAMLPFLASAVFLIAGYLFSVKAMRVGEVSFVSPFRYSNLLWAMLVGVLVFRDIPTGTMLAGSAIVVVTGLCSFWYERRSTQGRAVAAVTD